MIVVADENIPAIDRALDGIGEVRLVPGRAMTPETVRDADALLVRSVTRVDAALLAGSRVRFVGSATAGIEHIDVDFLAAQKIAFTAAPGSNAQSVADYVAAALFLLRACARHQFDPAIVGPIAPATLDRFASGLRRLSIGIIGVGQVGSRVRRFAEALGMQVRLCDPPLARASSDPAFQSLDALAERDIVTLHVPLTASGPDATANLIGAEFLRRLSDGALVINTCRGGVIDEPALLNELASGRLTAILDVWSGEPAIAPTLFNQVALGTPHIAGYAADAKLRGTETVYRALCARFGLTPHWSAAVEFPPIENEISLADTLETPAPSSSNPGNLAQRPLIPEDAIAPLIRSAFPIERDHAALATIMDLPPDPRIRAFDLLRKNYPHRREYAATRITGASGEVALLARSFGFTVD